MKYTPFDIIDDASLDVSVVEINPQPILPQSDIGFWIDPDRLGDILGETPREPNRA
jgi:hypothetical protein